MYITCLSVYLWLCLWSVTQLIVSNAAGIVGGDVDTCHVSLAGCKYKVIVRAAPGSDCGNGGMAGDDPDAGNTNNHLRTGDVHNEAAAAEVDLAASVRKIENLEQTLIRMMEGLSQRSLRHIRQIKTDLRHMSETMNHLKAKSNAVPSPLMSGGPVASALVNGKKSNSNGALMCPTEFVGGGTWPSCYRFSLFNASWHEAREYCLAFGANLVSLDSIKEAYIIDYLLKSTPEYQEPKGWWTSGNYIVRSQKWMWTSRQHLRPITFSRWAPGEPNARSTMHCLLLYKPEKYHWHDGTCTDKHAFICEIEL